MTTINKLIEAFISYGQENNWDDSEIIDKLIDMGITEKDFIECGYTTFVKNYFESVEE